MQRVQGVTFEEGIKMHRVDGISLENRDKKCR